MERKERIKELAKKASNILLESNDFTYGDMAVAIAYLVCILDDLNKNAPNAESDSFAKFVCDMLGAVHKVHSDQPSWKPSTEHPLVDEEVIALVGENKMISFAHIVDKNKAIDYDGWNIPDVRCWIPCPKIEED